MSLEQVTGGLHTCTCTCKPVLGSGYSSVITSYKIMKELSLLTLGAHAQRRLQYLVGLSVCLCLFSQYRLQGGQKAILMGSVPHWLDLKNGDFRKSTAFKSYGVKTKRTSQYANEHGLPRPDSARFEHGVGSTSNTKGEYVVLVAQKHYLPT